MLSGLDLAAESGPRYDDAMSLHDKGAVHGQSKVAVSWGFVAALKRLGNQVLELRQSLSGHRRYRNNRSILEQSAEGKNFDFLFDLLNSRRRHQIGFGNSEDRHLHAEQVDDIQMFFGLGHDAVIGGDGKKNQIYKVRHSDQL